MTISRTTNSAEPAPRAPLTRPHFFSGRLLDARDLAVEQSYQREKLRRLVRTIFGWGIADGLSVGIERGPGGGVRIGPGVAIDALGELIELPCAQRLELPASGLRLHVVLAYAEEPSDPVPTPSGVGTEPTRIRETFRLGLETQPAPDALVLARLTRSRSRWRVDRRFRRRRLKRAARRGA